MAIKSPGLQNSGNPGVAIPMRKRCQQSCSRALQAILIALISLCMTGCYCCRHVATAIADSQQYAAEFNEHGDGIPPRKYTGSCVGQARRDDQVFREYRFNGILAGGDDRSLAILIPVVGEHEVGRIIVTESGDSKGEVAPAELHLLWSREWRYCHSPARSNQLTGNDLAALCELFPGYSSHTEEGAHQLLANFFERNKAPDVYFIAANETEFEAQNIYTVADLEIEWRVRSSSDIFMLHLNYLWAIPVDVVTLPGAIIYWML